MIYDVCLTFLPVPSPLQREGRVRVYSIVVATFFLAFIFFIVHRLSFFSPFLSGVWFGLSTLAWITWVLWPWRRPQPQEALKKMAVGSFLRFGCVAAMAIWGFRHNFVGGLVGIVSFGCGFLVVTFIHHWARP